MVETKTITIIDDGTSISALAIKPLLTGRTVPPEVRAIWERAGFPAEHAHEYVMLIDLTTGEATFDPFAWSARTGRTMRLAHRSLVEDWNWTLNGDTLDVRVAAAFTRERA